METTIQPLMKPVLVTNISDDIRAIKGTDVAQQQTVLSARAINDVFAGDTIDKTINSFDSKYYNTDEKIDLDLVTDGGCRYLAAGSYVNGPSVSKDSSGNVLKGFIYTLAMLPNGALTWGGSTRSSITTSPETPVAVDARTSSTALPEGTAIRQLFYPNNTSKDDPGSYSRIGTWVAATSTVAAHYDWGAWSLTSGDKFQIVVTDPNISEVASPIVNAVYSVHTTISPFVLPDATDYKYGETITIIQYPNPEGTAVDSWYTIVTTTEYDGSIRSTKCTPISNRNTVKSSSATFDGLNPAVYEFEVACYVDDSGTEHKVWELNTQADETEYTGGLAEMFDAHTDVGVNDIVGYADMKFHDDDATIAQLKTDDIVINRAMMTSGYVHGKISKSSALNGDWTLVVSKIVPSGDSSFSQVTASVPSSGVLYFIKQGDEYRLVLDEAGDLEPGYLHTFPAGYTFYTLKSSAPKTNIITYVAANYSGEDEMAFHAQVNRDDILYISIHPASNQNHKLARDYVSLCIGVSPDPHKGSYLHTSEINPSAFTQLQLARLRDRNIICGDSGLKASEIPASTEALCEAYSDLSTKLSSSGLMSKGARAVEELGDGLPNILTDTGFYRIEFNHDSWNVYREMVSSSRSLYNYNYVVGETVGIVYINGVKTTIESTAVLEYNSSTGEYTSTQDSTYQASKTYYWKRSVTWNPSLSNDSAYPYGAICTQTIDLINIGSQVAPSGMVNEEDQYRETEDSSPVSTTQYYIYNRNTKQFETTSPGEVFDETKKPYYEKKDASLCIRDTGFVTQLLVQFANQPNVWMRQRIRTYNSEGTSYTDAWSIWVKLAVPEVFKKITTTNVTTADITAVLKQGNPVIFYTAAVGDTTSNVYLPTPASYALETRLKFNVASGTSGVSTTTVFSYYDNQSTPVQHTHTFTIGDDASVVGYTELEFKVAEISGIYHWMYKSYSSTGVRWVKFN